VLLFLGRVDVRLQVHRPRTHVHTRGHPVHLDAYEVVGHDLQPFPLDRLAYVELGGAHRWRGEKANAASKHQDLLSRMLPLLASL
jgi:hypothetical protein